jgi:hypothetical protein
MLRRSPHPSWNGCSTGTERCRFAMTSSLVTMNSPTKNRARDRQAAHAAESVNVWIGLPLAVVSALIVSWAYVREQSAVAALCTISLTHPHRAVRALMRTRAWLFGFAAEVGSWLVNFTALRLAPLALVQSVAAAASPDVAARASRGHETAGGRRDLARRHRAADRRIRARVTRLAERLSRQRSVGDGGHRLACDQRGTDRSRHRALPPAPAPGAAARDPAACLRSRHPQQSAAGPRARPSHLPVPAQPKIRGTFGSKRPRRQCAVVVQEGGARR